jgi:hypothetical protein
MKELLSELQDTAQRIAKRETQRFPEAASVGDCVRQGDIYITLLDNIPAGYERQAKWNRQLAPGNSPGSRHVLDSRTGVRCYLNPHATEFDGPVLVLNRERELTHPEHGNWILPPNVYAISYQRTQDALDEQRRVQD